MVGVVTVETTLVVTCGKPSALEHLLQGELVCLRISTFTTRSFLHYQTVDYNI